MTDITYRQISGMNYPIHLVCHSLVISDAETILKQVQHRVRMAGQKEQIKTTTIMQQEIYNTSCTVMPNLFRHLMVLDYRKTNKKDK